VIDSAGRINVVSEDSLQPCTESDANSDDLIELAEQRMPFGRYQGSLLIDLPEHYVVWFANSGFPEGKLGRMLQTVYVIKVNGLEYLFEPLRRNNFQQT
jgi:uncharacterized protein (DUF3820 family)